MVAEKQKDDFSHGISDHVLYCVLTGEASYRVGCCRESISYVGTCERVLLQ